MNRRERRRWLRKVRASGAPADAVKVAAWLAVHADESGSVEVYDDDLTDVKTGHSLPLLDGVPRRWLR